MRDHYEEERLRDLDKLCRDLFKIGGVGFGTSISIPPRYDENNERIFDEYVSVGMVIIRDPKVIEVFKKLYENLNE